MFSPHAFLDNELKTILHRPLFKFNELSSQVVSLKCISTHFFMVFTAHLELQIPKVGSGLNI